MFMTPFRWIFIISYSFLLSIFTPIFVIPFAPLLTFIYTRTTYIISLWSAFLIGLYVDMMSWHHPIALHAITYSLTTFAVYRYQRLFMFDEWWLFSLYTLIFSFFHTLLHTAFHHVFRAPFVFSNLFILPCLDTLFALFLFTMPLSILYHLAKYLKQRIKQWRVAWK